MPVLWDKKTSQIVNNESADIVRMFNNACNEFAKHPEVDLYPQELKGKIDGVNEWVSAQGCCDVQTSQKIDGKLGVPVL